MEWAFAVLVLVALLVAYVVWLSGRIGRLHARVAASYLALDAQLAHRANAATTLAHSRRSALPIESERVCEAAKACLSAHPDDREAVENDLTRELAGLPLDPAEPRAADLLAATRMVVVARQVHNDAVRDTLGLRGARVPRALRLGSRHPLPAYFDIAEPTLEPVSGSRGVGQPTPGPGIRGT